MNARQYWLGLKSVAADKALMVSFLLLVLMGLTLFFTVSHFDRLRDIPRQTCQSKYSVACDLFYGEEIEVPGWYPYYINEEGEKTIWRSKIAFTNTRG